MPLSHYATTANEKSPAPATQVKTAKANQFAEVIVENWLSLGPLSFFIDTRELRRTLNDFLSLSESVLT